MDPHAFRFGDGSTVSTIEQLRDFLKVAPEHVTGHHITAERNDYASWILHVHNNQALASHVQDQDSVKRVVHVLDMFLDHDKRSAAQPPQVEDHHVPELEDHHQEHPPTEKPRHAPPSPSRSSKPAPEHDAATYKPPAHEQAPEEHHHHGPQKPHIPSAGPERQTVGAQQQLPPFIPTAEKHRRFSAKEFFLGFAIGVIAALIVYQIGSFL